MPCHAESNAERKILNIIITVSLHVCTKGSLSSKLYKVTYIYLMIVHLDQTSPYCHEMMLKVHNLVEEMNISQLYTAVHLARCTTRGNFAIWKTVCPSLDSFTNYFHEPKKVFTVYGILIDISDEEYWRVSMPVNWELGLALKNSWELGSPS